MSIPAFLPQGFHSSVVKVLSYADKTLSGVLLNPFYSEQMPFSNMMRLLELMQEIQARAEQRPALAAGSIAPRLGPVGAAASPASVAATDRALATFKIDVLFRQNASWQGSVVWVDKNLECQFRSVLELVLLMDNVCSSLALRAGQSEIA